MIRRLGKAPRRHDPRTLKLARYLLPAALPPAPAAVDWYSKAQPAGNWGMMLNDQLGDCTCAAAGHLIEAWTGNAGELVVPPDSAILDAYEGACGYQPGAPATDQGGVELDVLNYWRSTGIAGRKILAYAALNVANPEDLRQAVALFGGAYIGVALPLTAQDQEVWDVVPNYGGHGDPGSWGGHAVPVVGYDADSIWVVTWGGLLAMSWAFWAAYVDEAYAVFSEDWALPGKTAPNGFNAAQLMQDLNIVTA